MESFLDKSLKQLVDTSAEVSLWDGYDETTPDNSSVLLRFSNGAIVRADYWRAIKARKPNVSSFDHQQIYGLPEPIDAILKLQSLLQNKKIVEAILEEETGDLQLRFTDDLTVQVFNFTGYEVWEVRFPDGTGEYSNHIYRLQST